MAESHLITGLVTKHSELAGLIEHHKREIARLTGEVFHIAATIKIIDPDYNVSGIRAKQYRKYNNFFGRGEAPRMILGILREAGGELTTHEITDKVADKKSLTLDSKQRKSLNSAILSALDRQKKKGIVKAEKRTSEDLRGYVMLWKLD